MAVEKLKLEVDTANASTFSADHEYDFYPIQEATGSSRKEAFSIAPPGRAPSDNLLLGISGMQGDITITGFIWNDGTDRANGTAPTGEFSNDTIVTLAEQKNYLEEVIHAPDIGARWQLTHLNPADGKMYDGDDVFVEEISIPTISNDSPKWRQFRVRLRKGGPFALG